MNNDITIGEVMDLVPMNEIIYNCNVMEDLILYDDGEEDLV